MQVCGNIRPKNPIKSFPPKHPVTPGSSLTRQGIIGLDPYFDLEIKWDTPHHSWLLYPFGRRVAAECDYATTRLEKIMFQNVFQFENGSPLIY